MRGPGKHNKITKKQVIKALEETGGVQSDACKLLNLTISEFWRKFRRDPDVDAAIREFHSIGAVNITDLIYKQALNGDLNSQKLYIKFCPEVKKELGWQEETTVNLKEDVKLTEDEKNTLKEQLFGKL